MQKIISLVGARPNFMKIAPFVRAIENYNKVNSDKLDHILVHSGQHYDVRMSKSFFDALGIPDPDINLEIGSGSHAEQVGKTMIEFERVLKNENPDWVIVVGDVNAILAGSVTAKKLRIKCAHIEAGLRSGDLTMPEEINRLVADRICDLLLTPDKISKKNLQREGVPEEKIKFVGNIMIDTLEANRKKAEKLDINMIVSRNSFIENTTHKFENSAFAVMTMHRPSNVDSREILSRIILFLTKEMVQNMPLIWPIHPRTHKRLIEFGLWDKVMNTDNLIILHPIGYQEMLRLNMGAKIFLTDSGGIQEECTVLGTPCLTLRWNTERPITLREHGGASVLVGNNIERIKKEFSNILSSFSKPIRPEKWDGKTANRIVKEIVNFSGVH